MSSAKHAHPAGCGCGHDHEPLMPIAAARQAAAAHVTPLTESEKVSLPQSAGRILAGDIHARLSMPRFDQSAMDGYAVASDSTVNGTALLPVSSRILAGDAAPSLAPGSAARIFTGAPLPAGADAVIMQEQAMLRGNQLVVSRPVIAGAHVRHRGEDISPGDPLLRRGTQIDARHIAVLAAQGLSEVPVKRRAIVAVISTGSELKEAGQELSDGAIYDSNRPMLLALAAAAGCLTIDAGVLPDNAGLIAGKLAELASRADLIVTSAGASVGDEDNAMRSAIAAGFTAQALRLAMKPGKPAVVGSRGATAYLGLPGNPFSAFISWNMLGASMLAALTGCDAGWQEGFSMPAANRFNHKPGRTEYAPARLTRMAGGLAVEILGHGVSSHLKPLAAADGFAEIAQDKNGVEPGDAVRYHPFHHACPAPGGSMSMLGPLIDSFGRPVTYLRLSVTDRCNFRCHYCMAEDTAFLPRKDLLSLEELGRLCEIFISRGVKRIRLTGGEPLVRKGILSLIGELGSHVEAGRLEEVTLTTNGSQLASMASDLRACGVRRVNVSLDTLENASFARISRWGNLKEVLSGIDAAQEAGLSVKINTVVLNGQNDAEIPDMIRWAHGRNMDLTLIEVMPVGAIRVDRADQHLALSDYETVLRRQFTLSPSQHRTGGPARYVNVEETGGRLGFITPLSHRFCESCNRVRLSCTGMLYTCLGRENQTDLRAALRGSEGNDLVHAALDQAVADKPRGHDFTIGRLAAVGRGMNVTGG